MSAQTDLWKDFEIPEIDPASITQLSTLFYHGMHPIILDAWGCVKEQLILFDHLWTNQEYEKAIKLMQELISHQSFTRVIELYQAIRRLCGIERLKTKCDDNIKSILNQIAALHFQEYSILSPHKNFKEAIFCNINDINNEYENQNDIDYLWREQQARKRELAKQKTDIFWVIGAYTTIVFYVNVEQNYLVFIVSTVLPTIEPIKKIYGRRLIL